MSKLEDVLQEIGHLTMQLEALIDDLEGDLDTLSPIQRALLEVSLGNGMLICQLPVTDELSIETLKDRDPLADATLRHFSHVERMNKLKRVPKDTLEGSILRTILKANNLVKQKLQDVFAAHLAELTSDETLENKLTIAAWAEATLEGLKLCRDFLG